jgi:hypothetical protein
MKTRLNLLLDPSAGTNNTAGGGSPTPAPAPVAPAPAPAPAPTPSGNPNDLKPVGSAMSRFLAEQAPKPGEEPPAITLESSKSAPNIASATAIQEEEPPFDLEAELARRRGQTTPGTPAPAAPKPRVFDGLEESEKSYFERMSNDAYDYLYPRHIKAKQLQADHDKYKAELDKASKATLALDHENGWQLDPTVNTLYKQASQASQLADFYKQQLINVKSNQPYKTIIPDGKGGFTLSGDLQPSPQAEVELLSNINQANQENARYTSAIQQEVANFQARRTSIYGEIQNFYETNVNSVKQVLGDKYKAFEDEVSGFVAKVPPLLQPNPMTRLAAHFYTIAQRYEKVIQGYQAKEKAGQLNAGAAANSLPASTIAPAPSGGDNIWDEVNRMRNMTNRMSYRR